jgi:AraC-like DNA-binding protein
VQVVTKEPKKFRSTVNLTFATAEVPRAQRLSSLRETVSRQFLDLHLIPLAHDAGWDFDAFISIRELAGVRIAQFGGSPVAAARTPAHIDMSDPGYYMLALPTRGVARARQLGRQITLRPGDLALLDSSHPYTIEFANSDRFEHVAYQIPKARLDARSDQIERALGVRLPAGSEAGRLASPYLSTLAASSWHTPNPNATPLLETGLDLLVNALMLAAGLDLPCHDRQAGLLHEVKVHARSRLGDPGLSPASVAAAHYLSTRQLHRLFAREGITFGTWVREQRLGGCRRDLADHRLREVPVAELAARWGYRSAAHFTRAFSARYGVGPREFRRAAAAPEAVLARGRPKR